MCPDYRVSSDQLRFNQRRFHVSLTKTVSVILCDDTQTPLCHSETKEKNIPLFRQNKLHGLHSTTRWHRAPATALSFMRQLPHIFSPNSGVFKKRLWDVDSKSEQMIVTFGFSVLSQFSHTVNRKMSQFGELRQKKKKTQNETPGLGWFYSFVQVFQWIQWVACLTRWHPSCDWVLRCSFVGFNRSVCQSRAVKYHPRSCQLPTDICPISVTS